MVIQDKGGGMTEKTDFPLSIREIDLLLEELRECLEGSVIQRVYEKDLSLIHI